MSADEQARRQDLDQILEILRGLKPSLQHRYGVTEIGVFGSWVRSETGSGSDLDVLVEFDAPFLSLFEFIALRDELSDVLGIPVDLVERDVLKPEIGRRILEEVVYV